MSQIESRQPGKWRARVAVYAAIAALLAATQAGAKWMRPPEIPVGRLLKNVNDYVKTHPQDPDGYYTRGRIQSAAFALNTEKISVVEEGGLPRIPHYPFIGTPRDQTGPLPAQALNLLCGSLRDYKKATELAPNNPLAWFGLGFECEEALRFPHTVNRVAEALAPATWPTGPVNLRMAVRKLALTAYRKAYALAINGDLHTSGGEYHEHSVSQEAAEGIIHLQQGQPLSQADRAEIEMLRAKIKTLKAIPRAITPILISFTRSNGPSELLAPGSRVHFDLSGEGTGRAWPWVKPTTGILVWDPRHTGKITSGLQLFGSVTWWLFWKDGYAPLAALDDDHNGWLEGRELDGIAVWFDRNGNGVADPGEVVSLASLGIRRIAVHPEGRSEGALCNPQGVELRGGAYAATYDWTPQSLN